ncbi:hypothetical protein ACWET9_27665 [Streptomyces sp. NPDC004059]
MREEDWASRSVPDGRARTRSGPADALHGDPVAEPDKVMDAVADAYAGLPADAGSVPTPLGPLPLPPAAGAGAPDAAVHAWDIAVATVQIRPLAPAPAADLRPVADQLVPRLREYGVFAPALACGLQRPAQRPRTHGGFLRDRLGAGYVGVDLTLDPGSFDATGTNESADLQRRYRLYRRAVRHSRSSAARTC